MGHVSAQFRVSAGRQPAAQDHQNLPSWLRNILTWGTYLRGCSFGLYRPILIPATLAGHVFCSVKNSGLFSRTIEPRLGLGALGLGLIFSKRRRVGGWLLACCVAALLICGFSPLGALLLLPLETRFSRWNPHTGDPAGIIVLGGGLDPELTARGVRRQRVARALSSPLNSHIDIQKRVLFMLAEIQAFAR